MSAAVAVGDGRAARTARTSWRPGIEHVFLVVALGWGVIQAFVVPPLQVPDEGDHWFRAWAITDGQLTADRDGRLTLPGQFAATVNLYSPIVNGDKRPLPQSLDGLPGFTTYEDLFNGAPASGAITVGSRVANYGPIGYLPQSAGVAVARLAGAPLLTAFYAARVANLIVAVLVVFLAIRVAPFGKQLFALMGLLPMTMYEFASVSVDALTIAGAILFIAIMLRASTLDRLRGRDVAVILVAAAVLLNVKPGYWALILLAFLVGPSQLGGRLRCIAFVTAAWTAVSAVFLAGILATSTAARVQEGIGAKYQLLWIAWHPLDFLDLLRDNMERNLPTWILESIGALGWLNISFSPALYLFVMVIGIGLVARMRDRVTLDAGRRVLLAITGVTVFLSMAVALYAFLEPAGSDRIFFQGRYLAPVWLLFLLSVYGIRFAPRRVGLVFATLGFVVIMVESLRTLAAVYHS